MRRSFWAAAFAVTCLVGYVSLIAGGVVGRFCPDVTVEKFTVVAAAEGESPYLPMNELAARYGNVPGCHPGPAPRTPAAFVLNAPLLLVPTGLLLWVMVPVVAAFIVAVMWAAVRVASVDPRWGLLPLGLLLMSPLYSGAMVHYASLTMAVLALVPVSWAVWRASPRAAGLMLGAAAAVKLWPGIIVLALLARSDTRRVGWWAAGGGVALTVAGFAFPGVSAAGTVDALLGAKAYFGGWSNWSAVANFGAVGLVAGLAVFVWSLLGGGGRRFGGATVAGLMLSPITWPYYWLAAVPAVFLLGRRVVVRRPVDPEEVGRDLQSTGRRAGFVVEDDSVEVGPGERRRRR